MRSRYSCRGAWDGAGAGDGFAVETICGCAPENGDVGSAFRKRSRDHRISTESQSAAEAGQTANEVRQQRPDTQGALGCSQTALTIACCMPASTGPAKAAPLIVVWCRGSRDGVLCLAVRAVQVAYAFIRDWCAYLKLHILTLTSAQRDQADGFATTLSLCRRSPQTHIPYNMHDAWMSAFSGLGFTSAAAAAVAATGCSSGSSLASLSSSFMAMPSS